ncbi:hypothetical protein EHQ94_11100 [Leptospira meyeri]|uniref:hypothetical protein n=1 Tax=Leptospira meyeri TaxID=29508 RepID=UPI00108330FA|nr:hypothetical protein [Leptospira meyeri]TGM66136.1 hypothetical protein EHQ94_11100 [Leptospira meyeri]
MNAKLNLFEELFQIHKQENRTCFDPKLFILYNELNEEEKIRVLDGRPKAFLLSFLEDWSRGISVEQDRFNLYKKEITDFLEERVAIGGDQYSYNLIEKDSAIAPEKRIRSEEDLYPPFIELTKYPIQNLISYLESEDPQTRSVIVYVMGKNENTNDYSLKLKDYFQDSLQSIHRNIHASVIREICRVIERNLTNQFNY